MKLAANVEHCNTCYHGNINNRRNSDGHRLQCSVLLTTQQTLIVGMMAAVQCVAHNSADFDCRNDGCTVNETTQNCRHYAVQGHWRLPVTVPPAPPLDNIRVMVIVWRLRGNIIRTAPCWVVWLTQCSQSAAHSCEQFLQVQQIGFVTLGPLHHA